MYARAEGEIFATLQQGAVYYFPHPANDEAHYFILLNKNPLKEEDLYFVCAQSNIENVKRIRKNTSPPTLVIITQGRYAEFSKDSIIDCNSIYTNSIRQLAAHLLTRSLKFKNPIQGDLLNQIISGVKMSTLVVRKIQESI